MVFFTNKAEQVEFLPLSDSFQELFQMVPFPRFLQQPVLVLCFNRIHIVSDVVVLSMIWVI